MLADRQGIRAASQFIHLSSAHRSSSFWFYFTDPVLSQLLLPLLLPLSNQERKEWKNNRTIGCGATCKTTKSNTGKETLICTLLDISLGRSVGREGKEGDGTRKKEERWNRNKQTICPSLHVVQLRMHIICRCTRHSLNSNFGAPIPGPIFTSRQ